MGDYQQSRFVWSITGIYCILKGSIIPPTPTPELVTVAVSVTDGTDGIEGAEVTLIDAEENEYTGTTGSAGGCNIKDVPEGTYSVTATATGYTDYESAEDVKGDVTLIAQYEVATLVDKIEVWYFYTSTAKRLKFSPIKINCMNVLNY